jgi:hypothetical protein
MQNTRATLCSSGWGWRPYYWHPSYHTCVVRSDRAGIDGGCAKLKVWIDSLAVPGKTFRYTKNGPEGLPGGKRGDAERAAVAGRD